MLLGCLVLCACRQNERDDVDKKGADPERTPAPKMLYIPEETSDSVDLSRRDQPARGIGVGNGALRPSSGSGLCPPDMVAVDSAYCVDRFEVHLVDVAQTRLLSPHYPPSRKYTNLLTESWTKKAPSSKGVLGLDIALPTPPLFQLDEDFEPKAVSSPGVLPSGYLTRGSADLACKNAGKRLCTHGEWVRACRGEEDLPFPYGANYQELSCNVHRKHHPAQLLHGDSSKNHLDPRLNLTEDEDGPLLRRTGETPRCVSRWGDDGIYDMVGNLDEWIADVDGTFVGGFYARGTTKGCEASIDSHDPGYLDYSLGTRCCRDLGP